MYRNLGGQSTAERGGSEMVTISEYGNVLVNYEQPVEEAVRTALDRTDGDGLYVGTRVDHGIHSGNFKTERRGVASVKVELIHFDQHLYDLDVLGVIDRRGYRPAELHELLALSKKFPNLSLDFPLVELGSKMEEWNGGWRHYVVSMDRNVRGRCFQLTETGYGWYRLCRFAIVKKTPEEMKSK